MRNLQVVVVCLVASLSAEAAAPSQPVPQKVIIDTDIGTDIDDSFALGLAFQSSELKILGISSAFGDTELRARLLSRLLKDAGHGDIPVAVGLAKSGVKYDDSVSQRPYAEEGPAGLHYPNAVDFLLNEIRQYPGEITLIAIGPLTNIGAAIDRDRATFRKLKRVVIMGGSVHRGYDDLRGAVFAPSPEYNIVADVPAAQKLFTSGVPLYVMPLDSTQIKLQEVRRMRLLTLGTPLTDDLLLMYYQWSVYRGGIPTLFDVVPIAYVSHPELCPTRPMRLRVDEEGSTRVESGVANSQVCLKSDGEVILDYLMSRLIQLARVP